MAHGDTYWHSLFHKVPGDNEHDKIQSVIDTFGKKLSKRLIGELRWSKERPGIRMNDLRDIVNEISTKPEKQTTLHLLFRTKNEKPNNHLKRVHKRLVNLMELGFPPVLNIERGYDANSLWLKAGAHIIVLHSLPTTLAEDATSFPIKYIDPLGGKIYEGSFEISTQRFYANMPWTKDKTQKLTPALVANFPNTFVSIHSVPNNAATVMYLQCAIGMPIQPSTSEKKK